MSDRESEGKKDTSGIRGYFQIGDKTIYWEGWENTEQAEHDIVKLIRRNEQKGVEK